MSLVSGSNDETGDGTGNHPYTPEQVLKLYENRGALNLMISAPMISDFSLRFHTFLDEVSKLVNLRDLKISCENTPMYNDSLSALSNIENVHILNLDMPYQNLMGEADWKFTDCNIGTINLNTEKSVFLERVTCNRINIMNGDCELLIR